MMTYKETSWDSISGDSAAERLTALQELVNKHKRGELPRAQPSGYVNNHIHTIYSFSPYSPGGAAYKAWSQGLTTAGIMDHDTVAGAEEFAEAGRLLGIATTTGFECRCSMRETPFADKKINNPDQAGIAYMACHGVPRQNLAIAESWLSPYREKRIIRSRAMTERINDLTKNTALFLDFDRDILPLTMSAQSGTVTERHLLYALALKIQSVCGSVEKIRSFVKDNYSLEMTEKDEDRLLSAGPGSRTYILLGVLKGRFVEKFYIDATDECPDATEFVRFVESIGAIAAYAYLGDVKESVTGDKRPQEFEDAYLDEFVGWLAGAGFHSITYMPTRNTGAQLKRIIDLCENHNLFQISGEDINSPFQSFICEALKKPEYRHLIESTWALIGHERTAAENIDRGMFRPETISRWPDINERVRYFAGLGRGV